MDEGIAEQLEVFSDYIREKGLRMTRQRELVVTTFLSTEGHLSTDELYDRVRERDSRIGYATVFRTLKALTDCGLARETDLDDGRTRFEHLYRRPQHHHIVCVECGRAIEFYSTELERLQERIVSQYDFKPVRNRYQIFGVCSSCQAQEEGSDERVDSDLIFARDALRIAMETEQRGMRFYQAASEIAAHETTRETFLEMLRDEEKHYTSLKKEWDRLIAGNQPVLDAPVFLHFDFEALKTIFPSKEEVEKRMRPDISEEEALRLALDMERDACEFFTRYAEKFNDTKGRDIFLQFAREEQEHCDIILQALESLGGEGDGREIGVRS
jgi:Fur family transcriptional regulator, ferric uptake regulator